MFKPIEAFPAYQTPLAIGETTMPLSFEGVEKPDEEGEGFSKLLAGLIRDIEAPGELEEKLTADLLAGKPVDTHEIMIAGAQGDLMLSMASTTVSKVANAYQTLINMQV